MIKRNFKFTSRLNTLRNIKMNGIRPFEEKPSIEQTPGITTDEPKDKLGASDLFSCFTADIIKERVVFTR